MDLEKALAGVTALLDREGRRYAVVGALALPAYGLNRATQDIDLVVERAVQGALVAHLEALGYETLHVSEGYSNHVHADARFGRLDFVYVDDDTARRLFAGCARSVAIGPLRLPVPRAEHLAAMKVHAMKNDPSRTWRELADIQFLLGVEGVDRDEIRGYFERAGLLERYRDLERFA